MVACFGEMHALHYHACTALKFDKTWLNCFLAICYQEKEQQLRAMEIRRYHEKPNITVKRVQYQKIFFYRLIL